MSSLMRTCGIVALLAIIAGCAQQRDEKRVVARTLADPAATNTSTDSTPETPAAAPDETSSPVVTDSTIAAATAPKETDTKPATDQTEPAADSSDATTDLPAEEPDRVVTRKPVLDDAAGAPASDANDKPSAIDNGTSDPSAAADDKPAADASATTTAQQDTAQDEPAANSPAVANPPQPAETAAKPPADQPEADQPKSPAADSQKTNATPSASNQLDAAKPDAAKPDAAKPADGDPASTATPRDDKPQENALASGDDPATTLARVQRELREANAALKSLMLEREREIFEREFRQELAQADEKFAAVRQRMEQRKQLYDRLTKIRGEIDQQLDTVASAPADQWAPAKKQLTKSWDQLREVYAQLADLDQAATSPAEPDRQATEKPNEPSAEQQAPNGSLDPNAVP